MSETDTASKTALRPGLVPVMQAAIDRMRREHKNFDLFDREDIAALLAVVTERDALREQRADWERHAEECEIRAHNFAEDCRAAEAHSIGLQAQLNVAEARAEAAEQALRELCAWTGLHLDALPDEEEGDWDEALPILSSLRHIVTGNLGCTDESDYTPAQWAALTTIRAALAGREETT